MKTLLLSISAVTLILFHTGCTRRTAEPPAVEKQPAPDAETIVGLWTDLQSVDPKDGNQVTLLEINEDGSFVSATIEFLLQEERGADGTLFPAGAKLEDSEEGKLDLATGEVQLTKWDIDLSIKSKRFNLEEGRLCLETTTIGVCDEKLSYGRIR